MGINRDEVVTLENSKKYLVAEKINYYDEDYVLLVNVDNQDEILILKYNGSKLIEVVDKTAFKAVAALFDNLI